MTAKTPSSRLKVLARATIVALASASIAGCASPLPKANDLPDLKQAQQQAVDKFVSEQPTAVERIRVPPSSMRAFTAHPALPDTIRAMEVEVSFPSNHEATLASLVQVLTALKLQITFQWSNPTQGEEILARKLPFLSFDGTVGELMSSLRNGMGLVSWYEDGMIYLSDQQRYSVTMPQNEEILDTVSAEVEALGAQNIVTSVRGGKLLYTASPSTQDDLIGPFLERMRRNLAVINMQVAVVSLALNDNSEVGFDWEAFRVAFDSTETGLSDLQNTGGSRGNGTGNGSGSGNIPGDDDDGSDGNDVDDDLSRGVGSLIELTGQGLNLGRTSTGDVFGTYGALSIASAVRFLSTFGDTSVNQNVSLKTLSGSAVSFQSGQEVPYVSGVSNTSNGDNTTGSTETETVETGLQIEMSPHYDADSQLVTLDVQVDLDQILDFVELSAGNEIGSITQPLVQKQNLEDLVQVQAGKTVVIGGLQYDSENYSGSEPAFMRDRLAARGRTIGSRANQVQRNALFIILRPSVTVYEAE